VLVGLDGLPDEIGDRGFPFTRLLFPASGFFFRVSSSLLLPPESLLATLFLETPGLLCLLARRFASLFFDSARFLFPASRFFFRVSSSLLLPPESFLPTLFFETSGLLRLLSRLFASLFFDSADFLFPALFLETLALECVVPLRDLGFHARIRRDQRRCLSQNRECRLVALRLAGSGEKLGELLFPLASGFLAFPRFRGLTSCLFFTPPIFGETLSLLYPPSFLVGDLAEQLPGVSMF
jgi:hypothetical protein